MIINQNIKASRNLSAYCRLNKSILFCSNSYDVLKKGGTMKQLHYFIFVLFFSAQTFAGILIEPYIGYKTGGSEQTSGSTKNEYDSSGYGLGARLGYSTMGFSLGLQYEMGSHEVEQTKPTTVKATEYDTSLLGAFVGFSMPLIRFWGSYFFSANTEVSKANPDAGDEKGDEVNGSGYGLGVGFTGFPFIAINLEYRMLTMDEVKSGGVTYNLPVSGNSEVDAKEFMLSLSVPLDF